MYGKLVQLLMCLLILGKRNAKGKHLSDMSSLQIFWGKSLIHFGKKFSGKIKWLQVGKFYASTQ